MTDQPPAPLQPFPSGLHQAGRVPPAPQPEPRPEPWQWTAKLPALLLGLLTILAGLFMLLSPRWRVAAGAVIVLGGALVVFSYNLPRWCQPAGTAWASMAWGQHAFASPPTLRDCVRLTR